MKRFLFILLPLLLLVCAGCSGFGSTAAVASYDTNRLKMIDKYLSDTDDILDNVYLLIDSQTDEQSAGLDTGIDGSYSAELSSQLRAQADQLNGYIASLEEMKSDIDSLSATDVPQVDDTIAAARHYFDKTSAALRDLMRIFDFYFAFETAIAPVLEFDDSVYTDVTVMVEDLYSAVETAKENLGTIDCPPYMSQTFSRYIKHFGTYSAALESLYMVISLQQYEVYDVLRLTSIDSLLTRLDIQNDKYIALLSEDFSLQYEKVSQRLSGELFMLRNELKDNCRKLIAYAG